MRHRPTKRTTQRAPASSGANRIRLIGGQWRGRKLAFPDQEGLRPTPDRLRETLFNWIAASVPGSRCLDLFAGSGALGLEALSRGCGHATLVDSAPAVCRQLRENLQLLGCQDAEVVETSAPRWLAQQPGTRYDLVFLDPPYRKDLLRTCCDLLETQGWLNDQALIYIEHEAELEPASLGLPEGWSCLKRKSAGQVVCCLYQRQSA